MTPDDVRLIERIQQTTRGARALLCTLARRGKALERRQPERAAFLLGALRPHPLYKGGRLAFDMLEVEDLMLDGAAVDPLTDFQLTQTLSAVAGRGYDLAEVFLRVGSNGRDATAEAALPAAVPSGSEGPGSNDHLPRLSFGPEPVDGADGTDPAPELTSSDYLYDLVVLGFLDVLGQSLPA
jgi:hypothetical protein